MKNARPKTAETSALDKRHSNPFSDLFPESLPPVAHAYLKLAGTRFGNTHSSPPTTTGQCAQVLNLIRQHQPLLSLEMTANHAIPEAAARVHDLRAMGFNILTTIKPAVEFRGAIRRNVALYSLGTPTWPRPGFLNQTVVQEGGRHE